MLNAGKCECESWKGTERVRSSYEACSPRFKQPRGYSRVQHLRGGALFSHPKLSMSDQSSCVLDRTRWQLGPCFEKCTSQTGPWGKSCKRCLFEGAELPSGHLGFREVEVATNAVGSLVKARPPADGAQDRS